MPNKDNLRRSVDDCFYGSVTVGERGQIVIPSEARADLAIKAGDKLLVLRHPELSGLIVSKVDALRGLLDELTSLLEREQSTEGKP